METLNRTTLELKLAGLAAKMTNSPSLNRTTLELKLFNDPEAPPRYLLSIAPHWN